jgi:caffeoyl-CoA O-methyltransferase
MVRPAMIVTDAVGRYLQQLRAEPDPVLAEMEQHAGRDGIPIVVPQTGALLQVLAVACAARRIVEVGTAIGVSTLYLARALGADGKVVSFDVDFGRQDAARTYLERAGVADRCELRLQDARDGLAELEEGAYDVAFIDGAKTEYGDYFERLAPLLRKGALLVVDNVLMGGAVADGRGDGQWSSEQIESARAFNERLLNSEGLTGTVTPVGDGVLIAVKR